MRAASFVEETVTAVADSGGGALTLAGVAGRPRFSQVFARPTSIQYVIENTSTGEFEVGQGIVDGDTLDRSRPLSAWVSFGGDRFYVSGAPIPLPEAPSLGDIKVRMAATAEGNPAGNLPRWPGDGFVLPSGGSYFDMAYPVSPHLAMNGAGSAGLFQGGTEYYSAYLLQYPAALQGILFDIFTATPGGVVKSALYSVGPGGPDRKIINFEEVPADTTGTKLAWAAFDDPLGAILTPGYYAIGFIGNTNFYLRCSPTGGVRTIYPRAGAGGYPDTGYIAGDFAAGMPETRTGGSLTLPDPTSGGNNGPRIGMWTQ